jgi:hypothetical protein
LLAEPAADRAQRLLYLLVESPDPELIRYALSGLKTGPGYPAHGAVLMRGVLNLWRVAGVDAAKAALGDVAALSPAYQALIDRALADPDGRQLLGLEIEREGRTPLVVERLRDLTSSRKPSAALAAARREPGGLVRLVLLAPHAPLNWKPILREEDRVPWSPAVLGVFAEQPGCPGILVERWEQKRPSAAVKRPAGRVRRRAARDAALARLGQLSPQHADPSVALAYDEGIVSAAAIIDEGNTACGVLRIFERVRGDRLNEARTALNKLTGELLADDVDAWAVALRLLPEFAGTLRELCELARAAAS